MSALHFAKLRYVSGILALLVVAAACFLGSAPVAAALLTIKGGFTHESVPPGFTGYLQPGDTFDFVIEVNEAAIDAALEPDYSEFVINSFTLKRGAANTGSFNPDTSSWNVGRIYISQAPSGSETLAFAVFSGDLPDLGNEPPLGLFFELTWAGTDLFNDSVPDGGATLADTVPHFPSIGSTTPQSTVVGFTFLGVYEVYGELNAIVAIPEPGTGMLLVLSAGVLLSNRRLRARQCRV